MSPFPTSEEPNPYAPSSDWRPGQDTFTAQAAGIWAEGFAAGRAAFDAVVAERDEARDLLRDARRLNMAPTRDDELDALCGSLDRAVAERDAAIAAGQNMANTLERNCPCYCDHPLRADLPPCSRCSSLAAWRAVSGSSEPRKETT